MSPADITHARTLLRMTRDLKARVVADAERQNLSESEWWRRAGEAALSEPKGSVVPEQADPAPVPSQGGRSAASPRARTAPPPTAAPTASAPRARTSAASKAGIRPRPKGKS